MAVENMIALHIEMNVISTLKPEKIILLFRVIYLTLTSMKQDFIFIYKNCKN